MNETPATEFSNILVLIDFSPATDRVVALSIQLAKRMGARLCLLHVEPPEPDFVGYGAGPQVVRDTLAGEWRGEHKKLQALGDQARATGLDVLTLQIRKSLVEAVVDEASKQESDLVVASSSRHGAIHRLFHGDTLRDIAVNLSCPILLVPEDERSS